MPKYVGVVKLTMSVRVEVTAASEDDAIYNMEQIARESFDRSDLEAEVEEIERVVRKSSKRTRS